MYSITYTCINIYNVHVYSITYTCINIYNVHVRYFFFLYLTCIRVYCSAVQRLEWGEGELRVILLFIHAPIYSYLYMRIAFWKWESYVILLFIHENDLYMRIACNSPIHTYLYLFIHVCVHEYRRVYVYIILYVCGVCVYIHVLQKLCKSETFVCTRVE